MFVAGLARVGNRLVFYGIFRQKGYEYMAVHLARLRAGYDLGHVAPYTVGKGVYRVSRRLIQLVMTFETLPGAGTQCLRPGRRQSDLMDIMAGRAGDPFGRMLRLQPIDILLVMALGKVIGIVFFHIALGIDLGCIVGFKGHAGCKAHRPVGLLDLGGAAPVVARTADLCGDAKGQFGRVNDGLALFKNGGLGQGGVP